MNADRTIIIPAKVVSRMYLSGIVRQTISNLQSRVIRQHPSLSILPLSLFNLISLRNALRNCEHFHPRGSGGPVRRSRTADTSNWTKPTQMKQRVVDDSRLSTRVDNSLTLEP